MTVSEYEVFNVVPDWRNRLRVFSEQVRQQLTIVEHSHGPTAQPPVPRTMMVEWSMRDYVRNGDKADLVKAAAWIVAEWAG